MDTNIPCCMVECYATKAGKIYDPYFYVRVPILGVDADVEGGGSTGALEIRAKNATDYRVRHFGDIDMKSTDFKTTKSLLEPSAVPGHGPHVHHSTDPFEGFDVTYYKLNEVPVNVGDLMLGFFLNGDSRNLVITHIPHKVPIGGEVKYD